MTDEDRPTAQFDYIKSNAFRVVYAEGVIGNISPGGLIHMALFSERVAIPRSVSYTVEADGSLGEERGRVGRPGYVREIDVGIMLTAEAAKEIVAWLNERINEISEREGAQQ